MHTYLSDNIIQKSAEKAKETYSKILKQKVVLKKVRSKTISFRQFFDQFKQEPARTVVVAFSLIYKLNKKSKEFAGHSLLIFESDNLPLDEEKRSYMLEVGNILAGSYLGSLSDLSGDNFISSAPVVAIFKDDSKEAAEILKNQLYKSDMEEELSCEEIHFQNEKETAIYILLKNTKLSKIIH